MNDVEVAGGLVGIARDLTVISALVIFIFLLLTGRIMTKDSVERILAVFKEQVMEANTRASVEREDRIKAQDDAMEALRGMARGVEVADTVVQAVRSRERR